MSADDKPTGAQIATILGGVVLYVVALLLQYVAGVAADTMEIPKGLAVVLILGSPAAQSIGGAARGMASLGVLGLALVFVALLGLGAALAGCAELTGRTYRDLTWAAEPRAGGGCVVVFTGDGREVVRLEGEACPPPICEDPPPEAPP